MTDPLAGIVITSLFVFGFRLGWASDWFRRLFRLGPYRRLPKVPYRFLE